MARQLAVVAAALAAVVLVCGIFRDGTSGAELEERAHVEAALSQLLAARQAAKQSRHPAQGLAEKKEEVKARMALRTLERSLQSELASVHAVLSQLDAEGSMTALHEQKNGDAQAAWEKKTMQRGAMRGESTEKQLARVLEKELADRIHKKLHWSKSDLESAAGFAKYLQAHPLPDLDEKPKGPFASLQDTANDSITSQKMDDGVVKVTFKREMKMTEDQYREMEKELKDAEDAESNESSAPDDKTSSSQRPSLTASDQELHPRSDSEVDADRVLEWKPERLDNNFREARQEERRRPVTWKAPRKSEGQTVKRLLERILGVGPRSASSRNSQPPSRKSADQMPSRDLGAVKYVAQTGASSLALASSRRRAAQDLLRAHGNFVHLPPRHAMLPASIQPYYWSTLPARDVRRIEERRQ